MENNPLQRLQAKARRLGPQAIGMLLESEHKIAAAFRKEVIEHFELLDGYCRSIKTVFDDKRIKAVAEQCKVKDVTNKQAVEVLKGAISTLFGDARAMLLFRDPNASGDWNNLGMFIDYEAGAVFARVYDMRGQQIVVSTTDVAYFDDKYMVPAPGSEWFWGAEIGVALRFDVASPFAVSEADPVNSRETTEDLATKSMRTERDQIAESLEAVVAQPEDEDAVEKLRAQLAISFMRAEPLNKLMTNADVRAAFEKQFDEQPAEAAQSVVLAWMDNWLDTDRKIRSLRDLVVTLRGKQVRMPKTWPGVFERMLSSSYTDGEIMASAANYLSLAVSGSKDAAEVVSSVLDVLPDYESKLDPSLSPEQKAQMLQTIIDADARSG